MKNNDILIEAYKKVKKVTDLKEDEGLDNLYDGEEEGSKKFGMTADGWDKDDLADLLEWIKNVEEVAYDIRNCQRGKYCTIIGNRGGTTSALIEYLNELKENLETVINTLDEKIEKESEEHI